VVKEAYNVGWRDFSGCSSLYYGKQMLRQVDAEASLREPWCSQTPLFRNLQVSLASSGSFAAPRVALGTSKPTLQQLRQL